MTELLNKIRRQQAASLVLVPDRGRVCAPTNGFRFRLGQHKRLRIPHSLPKFQTGA